VRNHAHTAIDIEPLLAATPALAADDPRLLEQVLSWSAAHADRVNAGRLATLARRLDPVARRQFEAFAATVNAVAGTRWVTAGESWKPVPRLREMAIPLERPALLRLRARALCGVGTRADITCDLLAQQRRWLSAAELAQGGHSKRNVARVLSEFDAAGLVVRRLHGNVLSFRLAEPAALTTTLGGAPLTHPPWIPLLRLATEMLDLASIEDLLVRARRVAANTRRDALAALAGELRIDRPPPTRGDPAAWALLTDWATVTMAALAGGRGSALGAGSR
jgi:hypothetical protein